MNIDANQTTSLSCDVVAFSDMRASVNVPVGPAQFQHFKRFTLTQAEMKFECRGRLKTATSRQFLHDDRSNACCDNSNPDPASRRQ